MKNGIKGVLGAFLAASTIASAAPATANTPTGDGGGCRGPIYSWSWGGVGHNTAPLLSIQSCTSKTKYAEIQVGYMMGRGVSWSPAMKDPKCWLKVPPYARVNTTAMRMAALGIDRGCAKGTKGMPYMNIRVVAYH